MQKVYSILDRVSRNYGPLFICNTDEEACRTVRHAALYGKSNLSQFPSDFSLYRLGEFDEIVGLIFGAAVPVLVCDVSNIVNVEPENLSLPTDSVEQA